MEARHLIAMIRGEDRAYRAMLRRQARVAAWYSKLSVKQQIKYDNRWKYYR